MAIYDPYDPNSRSGTGTVLPGGSNESGSSNVWNTLLNTGTGLLTNYLNSKSSSGVKKTIGKKSKSDKKLAAAAQASFADTQAALQDAEKTKLSILGSLGAEGTYDPIDDPYGPNSPFTKTASGMQIFDPDKARLGLFGTPTNTGTGTTPNTSEADRINSLVMGDKKLNRINKILNKHGITGSTLTKDSTYADVLEFARTFQTSNPRAYKKILSVGLRGFNYTPPSPIPGAPQASFAAGWGRPEFIAGLEGGLADSPLGFVYSSLFQGLHNAGINPGAPGTPGTPGAPGTGMPSTGLPGDRVNPTKYAEAFFNSSMGRAASYQTALSEQLVRGEGPLYEKLHRQITAPIFDGAVQLGRENLNVLRTMIGRGGSARRAGLREAMELSSALDTRTQMSNALKDSELQLFRTAQLFSQQVASFNVNLVESLPLIGRNYQNTLQRLTEFYTSVLIPTVSTLKASGFNAKLMLEQAKLRERMNNTNLLISGATSILDNILKPTLNTNQGNPPGSTNNTTPIYT